MSSMPITPTQREIFDTDFNKYCVIPSDEHVIENLSRLRVRPKTVNNESIGLGNNRDSNVGHKYSHKIQYEKNVLNLSENSFTDNEDIEKKECSTAGDNTSQSVYTNSDSNSDTLWAPEPQSPSHLTPPKLPQKLPENLVKKFNTENDIIVINTGEGIITSPSIAPVANTSPTEAETSCRSGFSFNNIITNAGFYVKQKLGLSTRTGTGVSDGVADEGVNRDGKLPEIQNTLSTLKLSPVSTPIPSPLAPGSHSSAPINYMDVDLNADTFITNASSPHMPYITFTACVADVWVIGVRFARDDYRAVMRLMQILSTGATDSDLIVKQMANSGFNGWDYPKCLKYFYSALKLYKKTLANCPNRETAATVYTLFNTMHSFVPYFLMTAKDLAKLNELKRLFTEKCGECKGRHSYSFVPYFLMTAKDLAKLNELKRLFTEKCGECVDTTNDRKADTPCPTLSSTETIHDIVSQGCTSPNEYMVYSALHNIDALLNTGVVAKSLPVPDIIKPKVGPTLAPAGSSEQNPIDYLGLPVTGKQFAVNTSSPHLPYVTSIVKVRDLWYRTGHFGAANHSALNRLLQLVDKHRPTDGRPMTEIQWTRVAAGMPRVRDPNKADTLEVCPNMDRAGIAFPMFYTLHVFSPECVMSDAECCEIKRLRELFANKCRTAPYLEMPGTGPPVPATSVSNSTPHPLPSNHSSKTDELRELNVICAKITREDLLAFTHLCHCVGQTVETVGPLTENPKMFWSHVSQLMLASGYRTYTKGTCRVMFTDHVTKYYKIALKYLTNYTKAVKTYPYFSIIYAMDLSQSIQHESAVVLPFNEVYNEICNQIKHNITSNTHVFEVFDTDFKVYCVIPSDDYLIENLSRLRVRPKTVNNESIGLGINRDSNVGHKYSHKIQYEKNELNLSENYINKCYDSINDYEERERARPLVIVVPKVNTLWAPGSQSLIHQSPQKLPQKLPQNVIKEFNTENGIIVEPTVDNACQSIATISNSSIAQALYKSWFSFKKVMTNAVYYVTQLLGLSTRTGARVSDVAADKGVEIRCPKFIPRLSPESTPIPSPLAPGSHPSAPINYLDVELNAENFATTGSSPHMAYITFTACVGTVWVTGMSFMLTDHRAIIRLMHILKSSTGQNDADIWVNQMARNGFNDWNYEKCLNYFYNALKLYKKTLANCPNRETAATVYPLFNTMDSFVPYFLMTAKDLAKLNELKRLFDEKCGKCLISGPLVNEVPVAGNGTDHTRSWALSSSSEQNPIDYLGLPVTGKQFTVNTSSPHLPYMTTIIKVKGVWFRTGHFRAANHFALNQLLQLVDKHRPTDGRPMTETEWERVAAHMPTNNKHVADKKLCQHYLQNALDLYKKILESGRNMDKACIAFPMFYTLHVFNPESVVSDAECREIARLRELFAHRCKTSIYIDELQHLTKLNDIVLPVPSASQPSQSTLIAGMWPESCPNTGELGALRTICAKITHQDVIVFTHLCRGVDKTVETVGPLTIDNQELFWSHVSQLMLDSGYGSPDSSTCSKMFTKHVTQYYRT
ncbi:unnamed protein product, partial [Medioppia subpectinata]